MNEMHEEIWSTHDGAHPFAEIREGDDLLAVVRWTAELGLAIELCPPKRDAGTAVSVVAFLRVVDRCAQRLAPLPTTSGEVLPESEGELTERLSVLDGERAVNVEREGHLYASLREGQDHAVLLVLFHTDGDSRRVCSLGAFRASLERATAALTALRTARPAARRT